MSLLPSPPLENVDSNKLPVSHAMPKFTKCQAPVSPAVAQAVPSPSAASLLCGNSMGDDILLNSHPHPLVASLTAPIVVDRPAAAPDPVTAVQPTFSIGNGATLSKHPPSLCHDTPLYEAGSTLSIHSPSLCHDTPQYKSGSSPPAVIHYHDPITPAPSD